MPKLTRMLRLLLVVLVLTGCEFAGAGYGSGDNVAWAFTINNGAPTTSSGLIVVVTYQDGGTASYTVPPGGTLNVPAGGRSVMITSGSASTTVTPGQRWYWSGSAWSSGGIAPSAAG